MERRRVYDEMGEIKKGPWKAEEDEVLIKHVKKFGPRDWSSIRSKGLLQRTGKSCRLRWVNKLRPNLKSGVKFSGEEERTVIELQGQFGNKWAKIATFLPGRTDNDVKNFWSSRQKRLARVLHTPPKSLKVPTFEAPKNSCSKEEISSSPKPFNNSQPIKMVSLPELINTTTPAATITTTAAAFDSFDDNHPLLQFDYAAAATENNSGDGPPPLPDLPAIPPLHAELPPPPPLENQEIFAQLGDPNFYAVFGHGPASEIVQLPYVSPGREGEREGKAMMMPPDTFIDDFPIDMFDPLPSPSHWS